MRPTILVLVVGCYSPAIEPGSPCPNGEPCPAGQTCSALTLHCEATDDGKTDDGVARDEVVIMPSGNGTGTVVSTPAGIDCGTDCSGNFAEGKPLTLTAFPGEGSVFVGWSKDDCEGPGHCTFEVTEDVSIEAMFLLTNSVGVMLTGNGVGTVSSTPDGIACPDDCVEAYPPGQLVELTATPGAESNFAGWSGACTGTVPCSVTADDVVGVTAAFELQQYTLMLAKSGSGSGTVTSNPSGINCGGTCSRAYDSGTQVTLSASPSTGSSFAGFSGGGCSGTPCTVTMTAATTVTANFTLNNYDLNVSLSGNGTGSVTSDPNGISCPNDCSQGYSYGQNVTLTATPQFLSTFNGWSGGGCSGTNRTCAVSIGGTTNVTASFRLIF